MELSTYVFYFLATVLVLASMCVVTAKNPIHGALFLVLAFFTAAGLWLLLKAEFLGFTLVLVYVGAVMVLFLFVVMMLDINLERIRQGFWAYLPIGLVVGGLMVAEMAAVLGVRYFGSQLFPSPAEPAANYSNTKELGRLLYTQYVYPFEIASLVLLVAIVAAVVLTMRKRKDAKYQDIAKQVQVKAKDRMRVVAMPAEKE